MLAKARAVEKVMTLAEQFGISFSMVRHDSNDGHRSGVINKINLTCHW